MKNFWSTFAAALLAFVLGTIILQCIALFVFFGIMASFFASTAEKSVSIPSNSVLKIELTSIPEKTNTYGFSFYDNNNASITLTDLVQAIKRAKDNDNIQGIYINSPLPMAGMASLKVVREALADFSKNSGKWVMAYADQYSQPGYYLSSVADSVFINPQGMLELKGLASSSLFYKNTLKKFGVDMMIFKVGTYKSAVEPYLLDGYSEANKEQIQSYMQGLWNEMRSKISASRHIASSSIDSIVNRGPAMFDPQQYKQLALVDNLLYEREVMQHMHDKLDLSYDDDINFVTPRELLRTPPRFKKSSSNEKIVVCYAEGVINSSVASSPSPFSSSSITEKLANELIDQANNDDVAAVVLRVNSPGGSAFVSEQIWDAVMYTKSRKPIVISMGDYAASGGYYISCAGSYIFAEPVTITGSIGIYGMFPNLSGAADKLELKQDVVKTHKYADALSSIIRPMTDDEKLLMQQYIERGYNTFITRVADGRGMTKQSVDSIAQGRVWTGEQALSIHLVDELGGLDAAIEKAASLANVSNYKVDYRNRERYEMSDFYSLFMHSFGRSLLQQILTADEINAILESRELRSLQGFQAILPFEVVL